MSIMSMMALRCSVQGWTWWLRCPCLMGLMTVMSVVCLMAVYNCYIICVADSYVCSDYDGMMTLMSLLRLMILMIVKFMIALTTEICDMSMGCIWWLVPEKLTSSIGHLWGAWKLWRRVHALIFYHRFEPLTRRIELFILSARGCVYD